MSIEIEDVKLSARAPLSPAHRLSTRAPPASHSTFRFDLKYVIAFRAWGVFRIQILDTLRPRSSIHYANYALRKLRIQILDTSGPKSSLHDQKYTLCTQNSNSGHLRAQILLRILLPSNRSTRLSSSGSIHNMMISRGRR